MRFVLLGMKLGITFKIMIHISSTLSQLITNSNINFLIFYLSNHINFALESISAFVYDMLFHVFHMLKGKFIHSRNNLISDSDSISANQLRFPEGWGLRTLQIFTHIEDSASDQLIGHVQLGRFKKREGTLSSKGSLVRACANSARAGGLPHTDFGGRGRSGGGGGGGGTRSNSQDSRSASRPGVQQSNWSAHLQTDARLSTRGGAKRFAPAARPKAGFSASLPALTDQLLPNCLSRDTLIGYTTALMITRLAVAFTLYENILMQTCKHLCKLLRVETSRKNSHS